MRGRPKPGSTVP